MRLTLAGYHNDSLDTKVLSNRDGLGAKVTVLASSVTQLLEVNRATRGDRRMLFGVGASTADLTVAWPSGVVQQLYDEPTTLFKKGANLAANDRIQPETVALVEPVITAADVTYTWTDDPAAADAGVTSSKMTLHVTVHNQSTARTADVKVVYAIQPAGGTFSDTVVVTLPGENIVANGDTTFDIADIDLPFTHADATSPIPMTVTITVQDLTVTDGRAEDQFRKSLPLQ